ncbi:VIT1/CCC1 transporter family protein [Kineococcus indalonis]|uniref:VIT1/CCC1 transporter family protein n=1 Tax=Kineococcus indalonis TaxID=2696566 RepID=UPI00141352FA|nr:VIT1/CCC1 transporter family protein [Kineococcus indalonis]NAZ85117.1 VIT family protein [Kineococcus indalonis]
MVDTHPDEPALHVSDVDARLNRLRAGVLGANDGVVSVAGVVLGVVAATEHPGALAAAGVAALVAGALSMGTGEYVSVSTQSDTQRALLAKERWELAEMPEQELAELVAIYEAKGLRPELAHRVAVELTEHDALAAHAEAELGLDPEGLTSPWQAALTSTAAFTVGGLLPLLAVLLPPEPARVLVCVAAVVAALVLTGAVSARLGGAPVPRAVARNVGGGVLAMAVTHAVGHLVGAAL